MGPVLSGLTVKVTTFLKSAGVAALHCWFGEDLDDCLKIPRPTPSNAQPAPASDNLLAALPARPAPAVPRPARAATPRPTSASVGRSPPIAFARNERIPLLLEEDEHADWIIKQRAPPRLHTPRTNYTAPGSTRVNVRGVGTRSQRTSNTFRGSVCIVLLFTILHLLTMAQIRAISASSLFYSTTTRPGRKQTGIKPSDDRSKGGPARSIARVRGTTDPGHRNLRTRSS